MRSPNTKLPSSICGDVAPSYAVGHLLISADRAAVCSTRFGRLRFGPIVAVPAVKSERHPQSRNSGAIALS